MYVENKQLCTACGGRCCQRCGCHYAPEDFRSTKEMELALSRGYVHIGKEDIDNMEIFFLRIRNRGELVAGNYLLGPCILWTKTGCLLSFEERPKGGKMLIPIRDSQCLQLYPAEEVLEDWLPYQGFLRKMAQKYWLADLPVKYIQKKGE